MTSRMRISRQSRGLLMLGVCLLVLTALPAQGILAVFKDQSIDNSLSEFARGSFQRASLGAVRIPSVPNQKLADQTGAVQLGPIGLLRNWKKLPNTLPSKLANMGTASVGNRMYIIGGIQPGGNPTAEVWSAAIDTTSGGLIAPGWQAEPALLAVHGSNNLPTGATEARLSSPAIASIDKAGGGYIYVIGGRIPQGVRSFSSYSVLRGDVGSDGHIVGNWQALTNAQIPLPDPNDPFTHPGLMSAAAVRFTTTGGRTFIYLIGGLQRTLQGNTLQDQGARQVWYAEVNTSNGLLYKPSSNKATEGWEALSDIPLDPSIPANGGLWDTVAVADHFLTAVGSFSDALYVIGGHTTPLPSNAASQAVYRALIDSNTGALTWSNAGPAIWQGTLPQARAGHGGALFRGNVYLTSGQQGGSIDPDTAILTTYVEDNLQLHNFGALGAGSDFLENPDALSAQNNGPGTPRTTHGTILVPAGPAAPNAAFLYIIGGRGAIDGDSSDDEGSDTIEMAKIGADEDIQNSGYAPDGRYYSKVYPITFDNAEVRQISWATQITTTAVPMDIGMDYRVSNDGDCNKPSWTDASWQPLDGAPTDASRASIDGQNIVDIISVPAHCFQYRAKLTSSSDLKQTPSLLNVSIRIFLPGGPDLKVKSVTDVRGPQNTFSGLSVAIQNDNQLTPPTLAADIDSGGDFFVDICIFGPDPTSAPPPTLPLSDQNKQCSKVYASVNKSIMGPGMIYTITHWVDSATDQPKDIITYFQTPGKYTVIAAVDSYGYVDEGDQGGENNNVSQALTFQVDKVGHFVFLPHIKRK
jgi:hypothetical protein